MSVYILLQKTLKGCKVTFNQGVVARKVWVNTGQKLEDRENADSIEHACLEVAYSVSSQV